MLTDTALKALKPREKPYKQADGRGLSIQVNPDGSRWWRFRYRFAGKEKMLSVGTYPDTSLKAAREKRDRFRKMLAQNIDPSAKRQAERQAHADTFEAIAEEFLQQQRRSLQPGTIDQLRRRLERYVLPTLGSSPIASIAAPELLTLLRKIEGKGAHETAHRVRALVGRVFRYAIATGKADRDPTADLRGALAPVRGSNFAAITDPRRIGELLRALDGYQGQPAVMAALRLAPIVFVRPGELRGAEWAEFDFKAAEWRIPGPRMKMGAEHVVPLSRQAIAILDELKLHTGGGRLLFPGLRSRDRSISDNTLNAALRRLGFAADEMTAHGFRSMASTRLNEMGWPPDVIELQLAHTERNKVRAAYNRAERMAERRKMMQAWADYLEGLRFGANVVAIAAAPVS